MEWNAYGCEYCRRFEWPGCIAYKFIFIYSNVVKHIWVCFARVFFFLLLIEITIFAYRCTTEQSVHIYTKGGTLIAEKKNVFRVGAHKTILNIKFTCEHNDGRAVPLRWHILINISGRSVICSEYSRYYFIYGCTFLLLM